MASYGNLTVPAVAGTATITPGSRLWHKEIVRSRNGCAVGSNLFVLDTSGFLVATTITSAADITNNVHAVDIVSN